MKKICKGLLCLCVMPCHAQNVGTIHRDTLSLDEVVCVGERPHYLTPSQTLQGEMLQNLSTTSVADALKYFSGVQIKDYGGLGGLKTVNVRSLGSQHVGVYLDGIRITNAQNGQVDLGKYSLSNMESVSLYNANRNERLQSASEYASAATVYMQTRRPDRTTLTGEYGLGSFGLQKAKLYFALKNWLFVDGEYQHSDGDYKFRFQSASEDTIGRRHNSDITFYRLEAAGFYRGLSVHTYYYNSERAYRSCRQTTLRPMGLHRQAMGSELLCTGYLQETVEPFRSEGQHEVCVRLSALSAGPIDQCCRYVLQQSLHPTGLICLCGWFLQQYLSLADSEYRPAMVRPRLRCLSLQLRLSHRLQVAPLAHWFVQGMGGQCGAALHPCAGSYRGTG